MKWCCCLLLLLLPSREESSLTSAKQWAASRVCHQATAAFVALTPHITGDAASSLIELNASSKKKTKPKSSNAAKKKAGAGFGSSSPAAATATKVKRNNESTNSIQYPELDPQIRQTLIPSPNIDFINNEDSATILDEEMYDRIEDIYGLEKFNFGAEGAIYKSIGLVTSDGDKENDVGNVVEENSTKEDNSSSLFDDILSGGGSTFSAFGGGSDPLEELFGKSSSPASPSTSFDLNSLPPYTQFRVLHTDPMVLAIDDFFTTEECDKYVQISIDAERRQQQITDIGVTHELKMSSSSFQPMLLGQSQTVGKDSRSKAQRTSTTWFHHYKGVPELMAKASRLLGLEGIDRFEEPQTVRYRRNEKFTWHLDALSPEEVDDSKNPFGSGQRMATLLVYLTDLPAGSGGATMFRDLGVKVDQPLKVRPKKGSALLFFPSAGGIPGAAFDIRTLHCGEAVAEDAKNEKWIAQLWLRKRRYVPTAPVGNSHEDAFDEIKRYCESQG